MLPPFGIFPHSQLHVPPEDKHALPLQCALMLLVHAFLGTAGRVSSYGCNARETLGPVTARLRPEHHHMETRLFCCAANAVVQRSFFLQCEYYESALYSGGLDPHVAAGLSQAEKQPNGFCARSIQQTTSTARRQNWFCFLLLGCR